MVTWINDLFRSLMSLLDRMVYWAIELLVYLFNAIASFNLFASSSTESTVTINETMLKNVSERIYILIAIVMVFKVSFSIIQYIINPDTFTDNERGMGKIIQNVVITLVCLVGVRYVFNFAYGLQDKIIKSHVIESLILGIDTSLTKEEQENISNHIPFTILSSFITPNTTDGIFKTNDDNEYTCNGQAMFCKSESCKNPKPDGSAAYDYYYNDSKIDTEFIVCINSITKEGEYPSITVDGKEPFTKVKTGNIYAAAYDNNNYNLLLDIINHKWVGNPDKYLFEYKLIISTVAGVFVVIMYLNFCIDLGVRTVKFAFLQLIAPIPIISMIDPKSSKNGMMSKWVKSCISTYLGLFIRIAAVSFVILIISLISKNEAATSNGFVKLFVIFGALQFAKELPKLISELTGINLDGNFKMNPFTRMPGHKIAGAVTGGVARTAGSFVGHGLGTVGAAAGSLAQAAWGAARGKGWDYNKDRVSNAWRNTGHSVGRNAILALNNTKKALHIPGKDIPEPFGKDSSSEYWSSMKHGEKLYKMDKRGENIYNHADFKEKVDQLKARKVALGEAQAQYDKIKNNPNASAADISKASKYVKDCETAVDKSKERIEQMGKLSKYRGDYRNYNDFKNYKDYIEGPSAPVLEGGSETTTQTSPSNFENRTALNTSSPTLTDIVSSTSAETSSTNVANDRYDGYEQPHNAGGGTPSGGRNTGGEMPSVGRNTGGEMPSVGRNTGGEMPSVGRNTGGEMPSVGRNNNNNNNNNPETPFDPNHMDG